MEEAYKKILEAFDNFIKLYEKEKFSNVKYKPTFYESAVFNVKQNLDYIKEGRYKSGE